MKALITGGTTGLGKELAIELSFKGYDLILVSRHENDLEEIKSRCKPNTNIEFKSLDLTKEDDCYRLVKETESINIDLFINNAGFGDIGKLTDTSLEKEVNMVKLNDIASLILIKSFLIRFINQGKGRVLSVCSAASFGVAGYMNVYYSTKAFVYSLSHGYHRELKDMKSNVTISMLCPGPIKTNFEKNANAKFIYSVADPKYIAKYTIKRFLKGKLEIVPSFKMKAAHFFSHFVPKRFISKALNKQAEIEDEEA